MRVCKNQTIFYICLGWRVFHPLPLTSVRRLLFMRRSVGSHQTNYRLMAAYYSNRKIDTKAKWLSTFTQYSNENTWIGSAENVCVVYKSLCVTRANVKQRSIKCMFNTISNAFVRLNSSPRFPNVNYAYDRILCFDRARRRSMRSTAVRSSIRLCVW